VTSGFAPRQSEQTNQCHGNDQDYEGGDARYRDGFNQELPKPDPYGFHRLQPLLKPLGIHLSEDPCAISVSW
jgi:hypothetical protein